MRRTASTWWRSSLAYLQVALQERCRDQDFVTTYRLLNEVLAPYKEKVHPKALASAMHALGWRKTRRHQGMTRVGKAIGVPHRRHGRRIATSNPNQVDLPRPYRRPARTRSTGRFGVPCNSSSASSGNIAAHILSVPAGLSRKMSVAAVAAESGKPSRLERSIRRRAHRSIPCPYLFLLTFPLPATPGRIPSDSLDISGSGR